MNFIQNTLFESNLYWVYSNIHVTQIGLLLHELLMNFISNITCGLCDKNLANEYCIPVYTKLSSHTYQRNSPTRYLKVNAHKIQS